MGIEKPTAAKKNPTEILRSDVFLDRYIAYRADTGKPMTRRELLDAAPYMAAIGGYVPKVAESIAARAH